MEDIAWDHRRAIERLHRQYDLGSRYPTNPQPSGQINTSRRDGDIVGAHEFLNEIMVSEPIRIIGAHEDCKAGGRSKKKPHHRETASTAERSLLKLFKNGGLGSGKKGSRSTKSTPSRGPTSPSPNPLLFDEDIFDVEQDEMNIAQYLD